MKDRASLELMKVNKENFYITCIKSLNIGHRVFTPGEKIHIIESQLVELEPGDNMAIYMISGENLGLCDIEIDEYFIIHQ